MYRAALGGHLFMMTFFTGIASLSGGSRIFPRGVRQLPKVLLFFNFVPENCMKMKEFGPPGGRVPGVPPLDPPMSLNVNELKNAESLQSWGGGGEWTRNL